MPSTNRQKKSRLGIGFYLSFAWLILIALAAILAPYLSFIKSPTAQSYVLYAGPSSLSWLGTDDLGRDLFARIIYGGRVSLLVGWLSILIGLVTGGILGLLAGYIRGVFDALLNAASNIILAFPAIILLLAIVSDLGQKLVYIIGAIAFISIPVFFRIARSATLSISQRDFILAERALGASNKRILFRHVLPNVLPSLLAIAFIGVSAAIIAEGTLAYLGLSIKLPTPSWGNIIAEGAQSHLAQDPAIALYPSAAIVLTTLSLNFIAFKLQRIFDVRQQRL